MLIEFDAQILQERLNFSNGISRKTAKKVTSL